MPYYTAGDRLAATIARHYPGGIAQYREDLRDGGRAGLMPPFNRRPARRRRARARRRR